MDTQDKSSTDLPRLFSFREAVERAFSEPNNWGRTRTFHAAADLAEARSEMELAEEQFMTAFNRLEAAERKVAVAEASQYFNQIIERNNDNEQ